MNTSAETIMLVSADAALRAALAESAGRQAGWTLLRCATGAEAREALALGADLPHALLIDTELPDEDGVALCAALREDDAMPLIMLIGRDANEAEIVRGLEAGAASFVAAPFRSVEMRARIATLLRLQAQRQHAPLRIGRFTVQPSEGMLLEGSSRLSRLTSKEIAILKFLHRAGGAAVSRTQLLEAVWNYNQYADTHTIETHIYRLRKKFGELGRDLHPIQTSRDGYRLATR